MSKTVNVYLFDEQVATLYQDGDRVYLQQIGDKAHRASPISISASLREVETTSLGFFEKVPGFVSDSLPGNFGTEILNNFYQAKHNGELPSIADKLLFIGDRGLGALVFKPQQELDEDDAVTLSLKEMFEEAKKLKKVKEYHSLHSAFLVSAHSLVGGARSKAVAAVNIETKEVFLGDRNQSLPEDFMPAIIKYDDSADGDENKSTYSKLEYVYYLLAKEVGIEMSDCYLLESKGKYHFITRRFDRDNNGGKYHVHSLAGLLHKDYAIPRDISYTDLFRVAVSLNAQASLRQLFLQLVFNYIFVNQDDHARNFSFMCGADYKWRATPAYDLTFAKGEKQTVEHQMSLHGKPLSKITAEDLFSLAYEFSIYDNDEDLLADITKVKEIRDTRLAPLMQEYKVSQMKQQQVLKETQKRTLQGALDDEV